MTSDLIVCKVSYHTPGLFIKNSDNIPLIIMEKKNAEFLIPELFLWVFNQESFGTIVCIKKIPRPSLWDRSGTLSEPSETGLKLVLHVESVKFRHAYTHITSSKTCTIFW